MKKNTIILLLATIGVLGTLLIGCNSNKSLDVSSTESTMDSTIESGDVIKVEKELNKKIKKLSEQERINELDKLLETIHIAASNQSYQLTAYTQELQELYSMEENITLERIEELTESNAIKGMCKDMISNHLKIKEESGQFFAIPDLEYILGSYSQYMTEELIDVITFRNEENLIPIYNAKVDMINLDSLIERELKVEDMIAKYGNDEGYIIQWKTYQAYYIDNLFGTNHDLFKTEDGTQVTSYAMDKYKEIVEKYPTSKIGENVQGYLDLLNDNNITDEAQNYVNKLINDYTEEIYGTDNESDTEDHNLNEDSEEVENN